MPTPVLIDEITIMELDHSPNGWPCVRMDFLVAVKERLEEYQKLLGAK